MMTPKEQLIREIEQSPDFILDEVLTFLRFTRSQKQATPTSAWIETTPGVCGGKPRIAGHRIRVQDIAIWHEDMGLSPQDIVRQHPSITLGQVYAALAYYHEHQPEIRQQIQDGEAFAKQLQAENPSRLRQKLAHQTSDKAASLKND